MFLRARAGAHVEEPLELPLSHVQDVREVLDGVVVVNRVPSRHALIGLLRKEPRRDVLGLTREFRRACLISGWRATSQTPLINHFPSRHSYRTQGDDCFPRVTGFAPKCIPAADMYLFINKLN